MREDKAGAAEALGELLKTYDPARWKFNNIKYKKTDAREYVRVIYPDYTITADVTADSVASMIIDTLRAIM